MADYGADSIVVLDGIAAVRKRPAMYVGDRESSRSLMGLLWRFVDAAVDEHRVGRASTLRMSIEASIAIVEDDGPGDVVDDDSRSISTFARPRRSPWLDDPRLEPGVRRLGFGGVILAALSKHLELEVTHDGRRYRQLFERGRPSTPVCDLGETDRVGTRLRLEPDREVFGDTHWDEADLRACAWEVACLNPALAIVFNGTTMRAPTGMHELVRRRVSAVQRLHDRIVHVVRKHDDVAVEVAMVWSDGPTDIRGFACRQRADEGSHIDGFWAGLATAVGLDACATVTRELLGPGLVAALHAEEGDLCFDASRSRLLSPRIADAVAAVVAETLAQRIRSDATLASALAHRLRRA